MKNLKQLFIKTDFKAKRCHSKKIIQYVLSFPIRLMAAVMFTLISAVFAFGVGQHYFIAKALKNNGEEARVLVLEKVKPKYFIGQRDSSSRESRGFYILEFADGSRVRHYSNAQHPVGKYIDIVFFPDSPTLIEVPIVINGSPTHLSASNVIVRGTRNTSLVKLYFSRVNNDLADYEIISSTCAITFGYLAIRVLFPFRVKR